MKRFMIPAAVILLGTGAAFATKVSNNNAKAIFDGYLRIDEGNGQFRCENTGKQCTDEDGPTCVWAVDGVTPLRKAGGTMCGATLTPYSFPGLSNLYFFYFSENNPTIPLIFYLSQDFLLFLYLHHALFLCIVMQLPFFCFFLIRCKTLWYVPNVPFHLCDLSKLK